MESGIALYGRTGGGMMMKPKHRFALFSCVLLLLFSAFPPIRGEVLEDSSGKARAAVSVPIDLSNGPPVVGVHINDQGPFPFALVTTSQTAILSAELVKHLGLTGMKSGSVSGSTGSEDPGERRVNIDILRVGSLGFKNVSAVVIDSSTYVEGEDGPRGMLGLALFADYLTTIDYANGALVLENGRLPPADGKQVLDYEFSAKGGVTVPLQVGDLAVDAVLDPTLPGNIVLNTRYIEKLALGSEPRVIGRTINEDGEFPLLSARFEGPVRLGGQEIGRNSLRFFDNVPGGGLGHDVLRQFSVTFDQAGRRVRLRPDDGFARQMQQNAAAVESLKEGGDDLRTAFNQDPEKVRLLLILSPT